MFKNILNAISSVFKKKPAEVSDVSVKVVPAETVVAEKPAAAPAEAAPVKKKRTYTKKASKKAE